MTYPNKRSSGKNKRIADFNKRSVGKTKVTTSFNKRGAGKYKIMEAFNKICSGKALGTTHFNKSMVSLTRKRGFPYMVWNRYKSGNQELYRFVGGTTPTTNERLLHQ